mmetsp:Transcript_4710/g.21063  ORF Transcript_4710/g.21063 Transcript_4710/m.21063 type:complete len:243 (+) Transcript_4710:449-1177(+)
METPREQRLDGRQGEGALVPQGAHVRRRRRRTLREVRQHEGWHRGVDESRAGEQRQGGPRRGHLREDPGEGLLARGVRRGAIPGVRAVRQAIVRVQGRQELRRRRIRVGVQRGEGAGGGTEGFRDQDRFDNPGCRRVDDVRVARAGRRRRPRRAVGARQAPQEQRRVGAEGGERRRRRGGAISGAHRPGHGAAGFLGGPREPELGTGRHARVQRQGDERGVRAGGRGGGGGGGIWIRFRGSR